MVFLYLLLLTAVHSEILTYTNLTVPPSNAIRCRDPSSECVINCNSPHVCKDHILHCHLSSPSACTINLNADYAAEDAVVYTHQSATVTIASGSDYQYGGYGISIRAYERLGTQLLINALGIRSLYNGYIYAPFGHGSFLSMMCGNGSCSGMTIWDDWTTTVRLETLGPEAFKNTYISNLLDAGFYSLSHADYNTSSAMNYRGSVYIVDCIGSKDTFWGFEYHGVNHGGWYIRLQGQHSFFGSLLEMTTDSRIDQSIPYPIQMYGVGNRTLQRIQGLVFGMGAGVFIEAAGVQTLFDSDIFARDANSLTIWCRENTECSRLNIQIPQTDSPNSFNWFCDLSAKCTSDIQNTIEIKNGYACSNYYLAPGINTRIYCGYDQTTIHAELFVNHTSHWSFGCGLQCAFNNKIEPVSIATQMDALCDPAAVIIDTLEPTTTTPGPTIAPTTTPTHESTTASPTTTEPTKALPCGGFENCMSYYDGCNTCYCSLNESNVIPTHCTEKACSPDIRFAKCAKCTDDYTLIDGKCDGSPSTTTPGTEPTANATKMPSISSTSYPSTVTNIVLCNEYNLGQYDNEALELFMMMPFDGTMILDASGSNLAVTAIEVFDGFDILLYSDYEHNQMLEMQLIAGNYTVIITGNDGNTGIYNINLVCVFAKDKNSDGLYTIYIIVSLIIMIILAIIVIFCCYKCIRKERKKQMVQIDHIEVIQNMPQKGGDFERDLVSSWLKHTVRLAKYTHLFLSHGYDNMQSIQAIENEDDLREIGIKRIGHQQLILNEIKKLQGNDFIFKGLTHGSDVSHASGYDDDHETKRGLPQPHRRSDGSLQSEVHYTVEGRQSMLHQHVGIHYRMTNGVIAEDEESDGGDYNNTVTTKTVTTKTVTTK
eukprot:698884_1